MDLFSSNQEKKLQSAYRKGCEEGYWQAKKELDAKMAELRTEVDILRTQVKQNDEEINRRTKVAENQINLLGRLVNALMKNPQQLSDETLEIGTEILKELSKQ